MPRYVGYAKGAKQGTGTVSLKPKKKRAKKPKHKGVFGV